MNMKETGKAIRYLRKQAGFTQGKLAEFLNVSDKAVSKWERGLSCPDISLLPKIAILLDTDIESLLYGHHFQYKSQWCGVLFLDDKVEIDPLTIIFDKPLVYFLLSNFLLLGINEILIIGEKCGRIKEVLGNGSQFGIRMVYDSALDEFIRNRNVAFFNGYTVLYGLDLTKSCQRAMATQSCSSILVIHGGKQDKDKIYLDNSRKIIDEKTKNTVHDSYYEAPFLFCKADNWQQIKNCESFCEMKTKLQKLGLLYAEIIGRGMLSFDLYDWNSILELSNFIKIVQNQQGELVACLEEISWRRGLISKDILINSGKRLIENGNVEYGEYVVSLV